MKVYEYRSLAMLGQMYDEAGEEFNPPSGTRFYLASDVDAAEPKACTCKFESMPTAMHVTTDTDCPEHGTSFPDFGLR